MIIESKIFTNKILSFSIDKSSDCRDMKISDQPNNRDLKKVFVASYIGNALETYDFVLSGILATKMSQIFFPSHNELSSVLLMLVAYGVGFVSRPLGAVLFGYIGDISGRKVALSYSLIGMSFCTLFCGLLPSYESFGVGALVLLFLVRFFQGLCIGGESQGSSVFVVEHFWKNSPSAFGAFFATSNGLGALLATFVSLFFISIRADDPNVWRYPFILGALVGLIGFYVRIKTPETQSFLKIEGNASDPFKGSFANKQNCIRIFLYVALISSVTHFGFTFVNVFLNTFVGFSKNSALSFACLGTLLAMSGVAIAGMFLKKFPNKFFKIINYGLIMAAVVSPCILPLMQIGTTFAICLALVLLSCFTGMLCGCAPYFITIHFKSSNRYSGSSIINNLAQGFVGGFFPSIAFFLLHTTGQNVVPGLYISALALILMVYNYIYKDLLLYEKI